MVTAVAEGPSPEVVEFGDVEVLGAGRDDLVCAVAGRQVAVPLLTIQPGSEVHRAGDRGKLVIPRWLAIGLGLLWPFGDHRTARR